MESTTKIKAIQTEYKGHKFRSRLEARWAIFFDIIGLVWEYEPDGYDLDGVWYLPDFRVYSKNTEAVSFYEIKPSNVNQDDKFDRFKSKVRQLQVEKYDEYAKADPEGFTPCHPWAHPEKHFATNAVLLSGDPYDYFNLAKGRICPRCGQISKGSNDYYEAMNTYDYDCLDCDEDTPRGPNDQLDEGIIGCMVNSHKGMLTIDDGDGFIKKIKRACKKSRQYKFHK